MRRIVGRMVVALVVGAVLTVVVAWSAVAVSGWWPGAYFMTSDASPHDRAWVARHAPAHFDVVEIGATHWQQERRPGVLVELARSWAPPIEDDPGVINFGSYSTENMTRVRAGWPWPALECSIIEEGFSKVVATTDGGWAWRTTRFGWTAAGPGPDVVLLPWRPSPLGSAPINEELGVIPGYEHFSVGSGVGGWGAAIRDWTHYIGRGLPGPPAWTGVGEIAGLGFAADTLFFGFLYLGASAIARKHWRWRRRRRGRCGWCGYDLRSGGLAACPECGPL
jgi:hypothetical protein